MMQLYKRRLGLFLRRRLGKFLKVNTHNEQYVPDEKNVLKWRGWDNYSLDIVRTPAVSVHVKKALPSEPPDGVTYEFGPTGYITGEKNPERCIIHTERKNKNNYCHWTFNEIPLMILALESNAKIIVFPDAILDAAFSFQARWLEVLAASFPEKTIVPLSSLKGDVDGQVPVNHDMSTSERFIGKCPYSHYHTGRATPYCIEAVDKIKHSFKFYEGANPSRVYINRRDERRLKNEKEVQNLLRANGFDIVTLEDLTLDQQVQLFAYADLIVGFHGAGLTNLLFCEKGTRVLEIVDIDLVHPSYLDGIVIPGRKAVRTYFHVAAHMKGLLYSSIESHRYVLNLQLLKKTIESLIQESKH